jgi:hypothetical protein
MVKRIAIVGTRGAGKTVFVTVLAKYLSVPRDGIQLIPKSHSVAEYVNLNYARLQRGEWIPSTNEEQELSWRFVSPDKEEQELSLIDIQGEVFQGLFAARDYLKDQVSERDKRLVSYLLGSSTVLMLINPQDFIDQSYSEDNVRRKGLREFALVEFFDALNSNRDKQVAIAFTAYRQYESYIKRRYTDIRNFLQSEFPTLYYGHIKNNPMPGFLTSAVADVVESDRGLVPKPGFTHKGLKRVISWIVDPVAYNRDLRLRELQDRSTPPQQKEHSDKSEEDPNGPKWTNW